MNDSFGGDFNATQTATAGAASETKAEGVAPVLIRQILESAEGNFQMWKMTFGMVSCAAVVRSIDTSSTKITYLLEDHTGRIDAHYWLEEGDALKAPDVMLNNYVKVYGSIRSQGGQKTLMIFKMFPITDPNERCTHILEMLNARYSAEHYTVKPVIETTTEHNVELDGKNLLVFQAIKSCTDDVGITRQVLQHKFSHMTKEELNKIIDFLSNEGHIYSSVDSDHFVSTES